MSWPNMSPSPQSIHLYFMAPYVTQSSTNPRVLHDRICHPVLNLPSVCHGPILHRVLNPPTCMSWPHTSPIPQPTHLYVIAPYFTEASTHPPVCHRPIFHRGLNPPTCMSSPHISPSPQSTHLYFMTPDFTQSSTYHLYVMAPYFTEASIHPPVCHGPRFHPVLISGDCDFASMNHQVFLLAGALCSPHSVPPSTLVPPLSFLLLFLFLTPPSHSNGVVKIEKILFGAWLNMTKEPAILAADPHRLQKELEKISLGTSVTMKGV